VLSVEQALSKERLEEFRKWISSEPEAAPNMSLRQTFDLKRDSCLSAEELEEFEHKIKEVVQRELKDYGF
jgi:uncharacterized protein YdhG (YjbR/CyaY superfamily)